MKFTSAILFYLFAVATAYKCNRQPKKDKSQNKGEISSRYWDGSSCAEGGTHSVNEFGANICEYPADNCPIEKYFSYSGGGGGVELCCNSHADCNYEAVKNYCHPEYKRCVDGSYFGCSEKEGPLFDECK